jgi:outer membrane assembly lipoprotein YfiO
MKRRWLTGVALLLLQATTGSLAAPAAALAQPKTEELQAGRWVQVDQTATRPTADPELARVEEMIVAGQYRAAGGRAVRWLKSNPASPQRDRALFLNAEALYRYGDRIKAFYYLDELMDTYPDSPLFYRALEKQYDIADAFLNGYKSRFLGMPVLERQDEGVEMMYRVQQRSPGSPLADRALLRTADHYYATQDYELAADAYAAYARSYPRSPALPRVKLRRAYANLAQFRGHRFDATPVIDARAQLMEIQAQYPELAASEGVDEIIRRVDENFARKLYTVADFYRRTGEPVAAVYTYRYLIDAYPESPEAREARERLDRMPASALETPPPGRGAIGIPSTRPTAAVN